MIEGRYIEIHACNLSRTMAFYQKVFNWEFIKDTEIENSWLLLAHSDNGQNKAIRLRERELLPQQETDKPYIFTLVVSSLDAFCNNLLSYGGLLVIPKTAILKKGWIAYCRDNEGNLFGVVQEREVTAERTREKI